MQDQEVFESHEEINQYEQKIHNQRQLITFSKALNSNLDLDSLIESILNLCLSISPTSEIGIYLKPDIDKHELALDKHHSGFDLKPNTSYSIPEKSDLIKYLASLQNPVTVEELESLADDSFEEFVEQLKSISPQALLVPLQSKKRVNGIIVIGPKATGERFLVQDKEFLADLAAIASIAVENARLYQLATVDMMTRLKIHHFFQTMLREEAENSRESGRPLCLILTDIDHFKKFNDTYGHQLGDLVLKEVAKVLIDSARPSDTPSRYGGEEFAMIMPYTDLERAGEIAEKIRKNVETMEVPNPTKKGDKVLKVTISIGVSQFDPKTDHENKFLIERCDQALYKAKHAGRNRVEVS